MRPRRVQDFIVEVQHKIALLPKKNLDIQSLPDKKKAIAVLIQLESDISSENLLKLLSKNEQNFAEITPEALQPFYQFLSERRGYIQKTDAIYTHSTDSYINKACFILIDLLSKLDNKAIYGLLMPPLHSDNFNFPSHGNLAHFKLHEFIIGNDGALLSVEKCFQFLEYQAEFDRARAKYNAFLTQPPYTSKSTFKPPMRALTLEEEHLIANHSHEAAEYYYAIKADVNLSENKEKFLNAIHGDKYKVTASYEEEGLNHLANGILRDVNSPHALSSLMYHYLPKEQWSVFISAIKKENLFRIVLGLDPENLQKMNSKVEEYTEVQMKKTDEILLTLSKGSFTFASEEHLRAYMLCLNEVYKLSRMEGPEFTSNVGYYLGYYINWSYPRDQKISSSDLFRDFLLSKPPHVLHDLEGYLRTRNLYDKHWGPLTTFIPFANNILPSLVLFAMNCSKQFALQSKLFNDLVH